MRTEPRAFACRAETGANLADAKYLGRCKLRLLELLLAQGLDAVFVDPGRPALRERGRHLSLAPLCLLERRSRACSTSCGPRGTS